VRVEESANTNPVKDGVKIEDVWDCSINWLDDRRELGKEGV
jgi:hypothetical protein